MNRRDILKSSALTGGAVLLGGPTILMQTGCGDTSQLEKWTGIVITTLRDVKPILADIPNSGQMIAAIDRALPIAEKLKKAFADSDHASTLTLLDNLINPSGGLITEIANLVTNLPEDNRRIVQGVLALGMIALRLIAASIDSNVPAASKARARAARPTAAASVEKASANVRLEAAFNAVRF